MFLCFYFLSLKNKKIPKLDKLKISYICYRAQKTSVSHDTKGIQKKAVRLLQCLVRLLQHLVRLLQCLVRLLQHRLDFYNTLKTALFSYKVFDIPIILA